jgi:hypothetical protein
MLASTMPYILIETGLTGQKKVHDVNAPILARLKDRKNREMVTYRFPCETAISKPSVASKSMDCVLSVVVVPRDAVVI